MLEFTFTSRLIGIALIVGTLSAMVGFLVLLSQRWHGKHTLDHDLDSVQKFHTRAVPRIGGLGVVVSIALTLLFGSRIAGGSLVSTSHLRIAGLLILAAQPVFIAGLVEDLTKKVSVRVRLAASIASALIASWLLGATIDQIDIWGVDFLLKWTPVALLVTAIVVAGGINAINIVDGFNGLASSIVLLMLTTLGIIGWHVGDTLIVELALLGAGATIGFLALNYPAGRLFLGDGGAYFLGFWVAEISVLLLLRNSNVNAWQVLSICAYPIIEVLFSIYRRRFLRRASPGSPDGLHLHTLVYRRVVPRVFPVELGHSWQRNAAVAFLIVPWIGAVEFMSVLLGNSIIGSIFLVCVQLFVYVTVYARIVRGYWGIRPSSRIDAGEDVGITAH